MEDLKSEFTPRERVMARAVHDGSHERDHHAQIWHQIHAQDGRLRQLERDFSDMRKSLADMSVSLAYITRSVEEQARQFDSKLTEQFLRHESRELAMQQKVMVFGVSLLITAFGALSYFVLSRVTLGAVG